MELKVSHRPSLSNVNKNLKHHNNFCSIYVNSLEGKMHCVNSNLNRGTAGVSHCGGSDVTVYCLTGLGPSGPYYTAPVNHLHPADCIS